MLDVDELFWTGPDPGAQPDAGPADDDGDTLLARIPAAMLVDWCDESLGELVGNRITTTRDALAALSGVRQRIAAEEAMQLQLLARIDALGAADHEGGSGEFVADEVAAELAWSPHEAREQLAQATELTSRLPQTVAALADATLDLPKAQAIRKATHRVADHQTAQRIERTVLGPGIGGCTLRQVRDRARRAVLTEDPHGASGRHRRAISERRVALIPQEDGMAGLWAQLPADQAVAIHRRISSLAEDAAGQDDHRTADQRRADVFADLLLGARSSDRKVQINVTVPLGTALGGTAPAELDGYGPIGPDTARELMKDATWRRVLTDPQSGTVLDVGRTRYRPPAALAEHVRLRDRTCVFPGCGYPASSADLDHTQAWAAGGRTSADNLAPLCRHHHRMKHETRWRLEQPEAGTFRWFSPDTYSYHSGAPDPPPD